MKYKSFGRTCFNIFNYAILIITCLLCLLPFVHLLALSFSSSTAVSAGAVGLWPVDFNTKSYEFAIQGGKFFKALFFRKDSATHGMIGPRTRERSRKHGLSP